MILTDQQAREGIRSDLIRILGPGRVISEPSDLIPYTKDTYRIPFEDEYKNSPDFVVLPETTAEVQEIVRVAGRSGTAIIPKGGGSNRTGMLVPINGGIIIDSIRMKGVICIDKPNLRVTVQPGITLADLEDLLRPEGLSLHQEQGSFKVATVGGSISTSGFSRKHQKYGTISDRVLSLEVVLADGSVLRTGPKVLYSSTGYRLHELFIGAEGTLGVITEATLRVEPIPESRDALLAFYDGFRPAREVAIKLMKMPVTFAGAEAYETDDATMWGAPKGKLGIFYVTFEGTKGEVDAEMKAVKNLISETSGVPASPEFAQLFLTRYTSQFCGARANTGVEDSLTCYIPLKNIDEFYDKLWNGIMKHYSLAPVPGESLSLDVGKYKMLGARFFIPRSEQGWSDYQQALREVAELATSLGGSISACHGVGIEHRDNIELEFSGIALDVMREIKRVFDPDNIMNPGKKIPASKKEQR